MFYWGSLACFHDRYRYRHVWITTRWERLELRLFVLLNGECLMDYWNEAMGIRAL